MQLYCELVGLPNVDTSQLISKQDRTVFCVPKFFSIWRRFISKEAGQQEEC